MRNPLLALVVLVFTVGSASEAQAQVKFGVQASIAEDTDFGIGGRVAGTVAPRRVVKIVGSFDIYFPDGPVDYWELNGNILYMIPVQKSALAPYVGGGLNIAHISFDLPLLDPFGDFSDTDAGLNLLGGIEFGQQVVGFVEAKVELEGGDQFVVTGGIYF